MELLQRLSAYRVPYSLNLFQESAEVFRVDTDLAMIMKIEDIEAHKIIEAGMLAVRDITSCWRDEGLQCCFWISR